MYAAGAGELGESRRKRGGGESLVTRGERTSCKTWERSKALLREMLGGLLPCELEKCSRGWLLCVLCRCVVSQSETRLGRWHLEKDFAMLCLMALGSWKEAEVRPGKLSSFVMVCQRRCTDRPPVEVLYV